MNNIQLNKVEQQIIQYLFKHQQDYVPSQMVADSINLSNKTVRKYIKSLTHMVTSFGAEIAMKKGSGYILIIKDQPKFYHFLEFFNDQNLIIEDSRLLTDNQDRERYILNAVLLENTLLTIEDLADLIYVSRSTVTHVIQLIKNRLQNFRLELAFDNDGHITMLGDELEKRRFILNYFFATTSLDQYVNGDLISFNYEGFSVETIFIIVLENCREFEIKLSDFVLQNLVLHIALAIKRIEKGFVIDNMVLDMQLEYSKELFAAEQIVATIESLIGIKFSSKEATYIALHLKSKSNTESLISIKENTEDLSLQTQIKETLTQLQDQNDLSFPIDQQLMMGLAIHFEPLLTRLKLGIKLKNPLLDELRAKYQKILEATQQSFSRMPVLSAYEIDDHEWAYISLHILAAIERYKQHTKISVIVICATGLGSAQMLKNRLENEFSTNIDIIDVISYYQLTDDLLNDVDLIVSTVDISTSFYKVPVIKVSVFLNKNDIHALNQYINQFSLIRQTDKETQDETEHLETLFQQFFSEQRFILFNEPKSREAVLKEMSETLTEGSALNFQEDLKKQILIREQFGTLAFTPDVAFPHPAQPIGIHSELVIGLVPNGVHWDEHHPKVKIIILMSPSKIDNKGLDVINSRLADLISEDEQINYVLNGATFKHFRETFIKPITHQF